MPKVTWRRERGVKVNYVETLMSVHMVKMRATNVFGIYLRGQGNIPPTWRNSSGSNSLIDMNAKVLTKSWAVKDISLL